MQRQDVSIQRKTRIGVVLCIAVAMALLTMGQAFAADDPPNVIVFYADDLGWTDVAAYGSIFHETPHIDRLAAEGMRFTQFYAHPVCAPSRAMLLSGQYNPRYHKYKAGSGVPEPGVPESAGSNRRMVYPESLDHLPLNVRTLAEALKEEGYKTWHLGKWHLGDDEYDSEYQGFDLHIPKGFDGPGGRTGGYFAPWHPESINEQFDDLNDGDYITERLTQKAVELIESSSDDPFFLYLAHYNVHAPYEARSTDVEYFEEKLRTAENPDALTHDNPVYAGMIKGLDESLGRIMKVLDERGLSDNTILVFTSDNGARDASDDMTEFIAPKYTRSRDYGEDQVSNNAPLRGGKADVYEGGTRVPLVVRYPGHVPPGSVTEAIAHTIDLYPTVLDMTPAQRAEGQLIDGTSLAGVVTNGENLEPRPIFGYFPKRQQGAWVRLGDYKLIRFFGEGPDRSNRHELYHLSEDIGETTDVSDQKRELASRLGARLDQWLSETGALLPRVNPNYDPEADASGSKDRRGRKKANSGR